MKNAIIYSYNCTNITFKIRWKCCKNVAIIYQGMLTYGSQNISFDGNVYGKWTMVMATNTAERRGDLLNTGWLVLRNIFKTFAMWIS